VGADSSGLALEPTAEMKRIQFEVGEYINGTKIGADDPVALKKGLKHQADALHDGVVTMLLIAVSIIKVVCYLSFFFIWRHDAH
jgi:hypothetical protein